MRSINMTTFTKDQEQYIEHEVTLRRHDETFKRIEKRFDHLDNKLNLIISIVLSSVIIPVGRHCERSVAIQRPSYPKGD